MIFLRWIDRFHWLWLLLAAPLLLIPTPKRSLAMLVVPGLLFLRWVVFPRFLTEHHQRESAPPQLTTQAHPVITPLNGAILLIAIMVLVSTRVTHDLLLSLPRISGMVLGLGVFFAIVREYLRSRGLWWSILLFLGMGVAVAVLGLIGTNWFSTKFTLLNPITSRIPILLQGLPGDEDAFHPNQVAGTLSWVLPLLFSLSFSFTERSAGRYHCEGVQRSNLNQDGDEIASLIPFTRNDRIMMWGVGMLLWLSTMFVSGVFILTQSRSAYIGMAVTILAMLLLVLPVRWRWGLVGFIVLMGMILGSTIGRKDLVKVQDWALSGDLVVEKAFSLSSLEARLELWSRAIYGLRDFPFTGMGMNTFQEVVHVLYPLFMISPNTDIGHAHNEFLQAGLDLGIPGLIAFLAIYISAFWMLVNAWMYARHSTPDVQRLPLFHPALLRATILGFGGGLLAHLLYGLTNAAPLGSKPGLFFWMLLGLIVRLHQYLCYSTIAD